MLANIIVGIIMVLCITVIILGFYMLHESRKSLAEQIKKADIDFEKPRSRKS